MTELFVYQNVEYSILIGKNRNDNWKLIDDATPLDIWFHVSNKPSPHIILKTDLPISKIPRQVIKRCACICKTNSNSISEKNCEIIYTTISNVVKTSIIGQVIANNTKQIII